MARVEKRVPVGAVATSRVQGYASRPLDVFRLLAVLEQIARPPPVAA